MTLMEVMLRLKKTDMAHCLPMTAGGQYISNSPLGGKR